MKTNVYIDGFNLYYGCCKETPYKWLNLARLCELLLPGYQLNQIRYFTALVTSRPEDPNKPQRQLTFLRALHTIPNLTVHFGRFLSQKTWLPLATPPQSGGRFAQVIRTDEKGSDVNLATYLLTDGFTQDYELAVVISNDSDLTEPIKQVREILGFPVGILFPLGPGRKPSRPLVDVATFWKPIRKGVLQASQFPPTFNDAQGTITKPETW